MDIPGVGPIKGDWDLRSDVDGYIGNIDLSGKRVLEIGPASDFLTMEMEKRGAEVVALEVTDEPGWDYVPFPVEITGPKLVERRSMMCRLKNSFWFNHGANRSRSRLIYADAYNIPNEIGHFDVSIMAAVLLHTHSPLQIVSECAKRSSTLIITDLYYPDLEGAAVSRLRPTAENLQWDMWWEFSSDFFTQFAKVLGFSNVRTSLSEHAHFGHSYKFFTVVASGR
jgi:O-methyltransferase